MPFIVDNRMREIVPPSFPVCLRKATQRQPHLIIQGQLLVPLKQISFQSRCEINLASNERLVSHVSEMLGQADHLRTFLCALLDQSPARVEVTLNIVRRSKLHDTYNASEIVLLRR